MMKVEWIDSDSSLPCLLSDKVRAPSELSVHQHHHHIIILRPPDPQLGSRKDKDFTRSNWHRRSPSLFCSEGEKERWGSAGPGYGVTEEWWPVGRYCQSVSQSVVPEAPSFSEHLILFHYCDCDDCDRDNQCGYGGRYYSFLWIKWNLSTWEWWWWWRLVDDTAGEIY